MSNIHHTAIIHESVVISENVEIGPYCIIGAGVEIGSGCILKSHVVMEGKMSIGENNTFYPLTFIRRKNSPMGIGLYKVFINRSQRFFFYFSTLPYKRN